MRSFRYIFLVIIFSIFFPTISAQNEKYVDDNLSVHSMPIEGLIYMAESDFREGKLICLDYIQDMFTYRYYLGDKDISYNIDVIYRALEYLAFEGTVNKKTEQNNFLDFPDVRLGAVKFLGILNINKSKTALLKVLEYENDILVLQEAIKTLFSNWTDFYENKEEMKIIINAIEKISNQK